VDYNAIYWWHHSPFLLTSSGSVFWDKLEDSTASRFWPGILFFIAYLPYASFSFFWWDFVTSETLTHFAWTTMFTVLYLKLTDHLQDLYIFDTLFSL
jgi:hypothetical protein